MQSCSMMATADSESDVCASISWNLALSIIVESSILGHYHANVNARRSHDHDFEGC